MLNQLNEDDFAGPADIEMMRRVLADYCDHKGIERAEASLQAAKLIEFFRRGIRSEDELRTKLNLPEKTSSAA